MRILLLLAVMFLRPTTAVAEPSVVIEMWLKKPGTTTLNAAKGNLKSLNLVGLKYDELESYDLQYEKQVKVRGFHVRDLLSLYKPMPENVDVLNLVTKNGMIVPISIARLRKDVQVFIAIEILRDGKWSRDFPESVRPRENDAKEVPVKFAGNKIVVGKNWRATDTGFTPWRHMDSLSGIEFIESTAYNAQFQNPAKPNSELRGRLAFLAHCQYCHGIGQVGASRAPDLSNLVKALGKDAPEKILAQVRAPGSNGLYPHAMPAQQDFSAKDAKELAEWLDSVRGAPLAPYEPSYASTIKWLP